MIPGEVKQVDHRRPDHFTAADRMKGIVLDHKVVVKARFIVQLAGVDTHRAAALPRSPGTSQERFLKVAVKEQQRVFKRLRRGGEHNYVIFCLYCLPHSPNTSHI